MKDIGGRHGDLFPQGDPQNQGLIALGHVLMNRDRGEAGQGRVLGYQESLGLVGGRPFHKLFQHLQGIPGGSHDFSFKGLCFFRDCAPEKQPLRDNPCKLVGARCIVPLRLSISSHF